MFLKLSLWDYQKSKSFIKPNQTLWSKDPLVDWVRAKIPYNKHVYEIVKIGTLWSNED